MEAYIRNCIFAFKCDKEWNDLIETEIDDVRFCNDCERKVYLCKTDDDLRSAILGKRCVAIVVERNAEGILTGGEVGYPASTEESRVASDRANLLRREVQSLNLSYYTVLYLRSRAILTVGDLILRSRKSLIEDSEYLPDEGLGQIEKALASLGLQLSEEHVAPAHAAPSFNPKYLIPLTELDLGSEIIEKIHESSRANEYVQDELGNFLRTQPGAPKITLVGDLVRYHYDDLTNSFALDEEEKQSLKAVIHKLGLTFGTVVDYWEFVDREQG
jgi:hypothetical protein